MEPLGITSYDSWVRIASSTEKYWIRCWLDGLNTTTNPVWQFSPLSLDALDRLWWIFYESNNRFDQTRMQLESVKYLAHAQLHPDRTNFPAPTDGCDDRWETYWRKVRDSLGGFYLYAFAQLRALVGEERVNNAELRKWTALIAAKLLCDGYSQFELYVRALTGVLDPENEHRGQQVLERIQGLLSHLERRPLATFVVWTVLRSSANFAKGSPNRISTRSLTAPDQFDGLTEVVKLGGTFTAASRLTTSHSISAVEQHRFEASRIVHEAMIRSRIKGLSLEDFSTALHLESGKSWRHAGDRRFLDVIPSLAPTGEAKAFASA